MTERIGRRRDLWEGERWRSRVRGVSLTLAVTAMVTGGGVSHVLVFGLPAPVQARVDILPDRSVMGSSLHAADGTALEEGQYRVMMNQLPTMKEGSQECNLGSENPPESRYDSRINLYLKFTGGRIEETRLVLPGKYVGMITLNQALEPGEHLVLAELELFDERKPAGEMMLELTVRVIPG